MKYLKSFEAYENNKTILRLNGLHNPSVFFDYLPFSENLKEIYCTENNLVELPELPKGLEVLRCSINELIYLPKLPETMDLINCSNNNLVELPELPKNLTYLNCGNNYELKEIPELPKTLEYLKCYGNFRLTKLPKLPEGLLHLDFSSCGLTELPKLPNSLMILKCKLVTFYKPIPYNIFLKFFYNNPSNFQYSIENMVKFSSFEYQKEFLERESENFMDLKPIGYAKGIEELFPHLFDMDELGLLD